MASNKEIVRRALEEVWTNGNIEAADEFLAPGFSMESLPGGRLGGPDAVKQFARDGRGAFPDAELTVDEMVEEGDKVAVRFTVRGTHRGEYMGNRPSNNRAEAQGAGIFRIADGKLGEGWAILDQEGILRQLGGGHPGGGPGGGRPQG